MSVILKRPKLDKKNLVIRRLSTYLRTLDHLQEKGVEVVSSSDLERIEGFSQSLVRRDLAEFGSFGIRGLGYNVSELRDHIATILGFGRTRRVVLIGAGGFGDVLLHSESFRKRNLEVVQIFDKSPEHVNLSIGGVPIHHIAHLERDIDPHQIDMAIITLAPPEVQGIIDRLGRLGIRGALYFASRPVIAPENMVVLNMDINIELGVLAYHLH